MDVVRQPGFVIKGSQIENRVQKNWVFNEAGADLDIRFEASGEANAFFLQGSDGFIGIGSNSPDEELDVLGDFQVKDADTKVKAYRFRTSGGALDCEAGGADWYISLWTDADFSATQRNYMVMKKDAHYMTALGNWEWKLANSVFGTTHLEFLESGGYIFNQDSADRDFRIESNNNEYMFFVDAGNDRIGINASGPAAKLHIDQSSTTGAVPVLTLDQGDVSEEFIRLIGESTTDATQSLVDAANLATPGSIVGWFKIYVEDVQGTGPITDGVYYVPFYTAPTA